MAFDPKQHVIRVRGGQEYLEVKWRLVWFRDEHPDWGIETQPIEINIQEGRAIFAARVFNAEGRLMATGTKMETRNDFGDFVEKAETGAIGRALAMCGYGTQFAPELAEGARIVDAPVQRQQRGEQQPQPAPAEAESDASDRQYAARRALAQLAAEARDSGRLTREAWSRMLADAGAVSIADLTEEAAASLCEQLK